eukprot:g11833.t1
MGGHGHGRGSDHDDDDNGEWMQLLRPSELREVLELDRARKEVERQIIHANQAKLAGRSEAERRGRTPSSQRIVGAGVPNIRDDLMSQLYSKQVEAGHMVKLLPRPGDGEKQKQLMWQKIVDVTMVFLSGPLFGIVTALVTLGSVGVYLYETTLDSEDDSDGGGGWYTSGHDYPDWFTIVEYFLLGFFGVELGLRAILADHDRSFWQSTETLVDVLSVVPSVLLVAFGLRLWGFLRFLRLLRWADIAPIVDSRRRKTTDARGGKTNASWDAKAEGALEWRRASLIAGLKLLGFVARYVLVFAGSVTLLDRAEGGIEDMSQTDPGEPMQFATALYVSSMILSTVGGPVPVSPGARVAAAIAVLVFLPLAAIRVADVVKHSSTARGPVRTMARAPSVRERHVVMCGSVNAENLQARLQEIFHADHGNHNVRWVRVVVISPDPPSPRMTTLLKHPRYRSRVTYIQGSPLHDDSLLNARVADAAAVMVLANKAPVSSHAEDMSLSLQAISVMTHVELDRRQGGGPRLLVELVDPNAALHLQAAGIKQVVSSAQVKLSVLAQSCLCPGWSAVVANLLESRAALPAQVLQQGSWLAEYYVGAKKTFYSVEFSPAFTGVLFADAVVHIFDYFELILVALETKRNCHGIDGESFVIVNPADDHRIGKGDRGFVLAESQADARVIWDYMADEGTGGAIDETTGKLRERFSTPEEEEALALQTLGTAQIAGLGPQAFVDSMVFSRTLLHCQKKLKDGVAPDPGVILGWARQFQSSDGVSDDVLARKVLASAGLQPPDNSGLHSSADDAHAATVPTDKSTTSRLFASTFANKPVNPTINVSRRSKHGKNSSPSAAAPASREMPGSTSKPRRKPGAAGGRGARERFLSDDEVPVTSVSSSSGRGSGGNGGGFPVGVSSSKPVPMAGLVEVDLEDASSGRPSGPVGGQRSGDDSEPIDGPSLLLDAAARDAQAMESEERTKESAGDDDDHDAHDEGVGSTAGTVGTDAAAGGVADQSPTGDEILSTLRTMEVSNLTGEDARRRLVALCLGAKSTPATPPVGKGDASVTCAGEVKAANTSLIAGREGEIARRRTVSSARHLAGHVVVLGFPARPSHLECFLRPLNGWTGGAEMVGGGGVPVVLVAEDVSKLETALEVVDKHGYVNTSEVYLLVGSPVSQSDLENAGVSTAKAVLVMKDPRSTRFEGGKSGNPLRDAEALVSFIKMEAGLLNNNQHVVVELENAANVRFLHARAEAKSLRAITGLGGAGAGGAADEAHYLWPKYAGGMTYNSSFVDSLFGQAFYRPSRIVLIEHLLLLGRGEQIGRSGKAPFSMSQPKTTTNSAPVGPRRQSESRSESSESAGESPERGDAVNRECCLRQMPVPPSFLGHSFGEIFQHLAAPPLRCVAFALLRARGTRNAPEPYVYTGPRADTVLHPGDKVFILGKPPVL